MLGGPLEEPLFAQLLKVFPEVQGDGGEREIWTAMETPNLVCKTVQGLVCFWGVLLVKVGR